MDFKLEHSMEVLGVEFVRDIVKGLISAAKSDTASGFYKEYNGEYLRTR